MLLFEPKKIVIPSPPYDLNLTPTTDKALVTVVVGQLGEEMFSITKPYMERYAKRLGLDFVVLTWEGHYNFPMSAKFAIPRTLMYYKRIAYVDADVFLRTGCVNLFDSCNEDEVGIYDEGPFYLDKPIFAQREHELIAFRKEMGFPEVVLPWMLNCGIMVIPRYAAEFFPTPTQPIKVHHCAEQDWFNSTLLQAYLSGKVKIRLIDRRYNWEHWTDQECRRAPKEAVLHCSGDAHDNKINILTSLAIKNPVDKIYVIASSQRSGSTWLCETLCNTGIGYPDEYLGLKFKSGLPGIFLYGTRGGYSGIKMHGWQLKEYQLQESLPRELPDAKYIFLTRQDKIRQGISLTIAQQTDSFISREAPRKKPVYDFNWIEMAIASVYEEEEEWRQFFLRHSIEPLHVTYEDLYQDFDGTFQRVLGYLGAEVDNIMYSDLEKQASALNEEWYDRYLLEKNA